MGAGSTHRLLLRIPEQDTSGGGNTVGTLLSDPAPLSGAGCERRGHSRGAPSVGGGGPVVPAATGDDVQDRDDDGAHDEADER